MTKGSFGLTIIEVLVALVILAVGVAAAAQLQATSLRFSNQAEQIKTATQVAEAEVEWRRQTDITTGQAQACASNVPAGYSCQVDVEPCNATAGFEITCAESLISPVAYQISVQVTGPSVSPFTLTSVTTGEYVAGTLGDGSVGLPPTTTEPPATEDPENPDPPDPDEKPCIEWAGKSGNCKKYAD